LKYKLKFGKPVKSILRLQDAFFICVCLLLISNTAFTQSFKKSDINLSTYEAKEFFLQDSIVKKDTTTYNFKMTRTPMMAVLYSSVLPGLGQFYNKSYWKIPIIGVVGGYFVYEIIKNNNSYIDYRTSYANSQSPLSPGGDQRLKLLRDFYRDQRDQFYLYAAMVYLINIVDAYVDAHLFDFDVSDRIQIGGLKSSNKFINTLCGFT
jgi:Family of unknown function (DUF5683)